MNRSATAITLEQGAPFDARAYRRTLGQFATGVTVVTARAPDGRRVGLTVNSFTSVSLEPPIVLWCLSRNSASMPSFLTSKRFAINVLAREQVAVAQRFASRHADRFAGVACSIGLGGVPLIDGAIARLVCQRIDQHPVGDHLIFIGEVEHYEHFGGEPLVFHAGEYRVVVPRHGTGSLT